AASPSVGSSPPPRTPCRLLFLAADPHGDTPLSLDEECRQIEQKISNSQYRDRFQFFSKWALQWDDLLQYLNQYRPDIVHFAGHAAETGQLMFMDAERQPRPVATEALRELFSCFKDQVRLVFLNACYTQTQAEAIAGVVGCSLGTTRDIGDTAAIAFAGAF